MFVKIVRIGGGEKTIQCASYDITKFEATDEKPGYLVIETHPLKGAFSFTDEEEVTIYIMNDEGHTIDRHTNRRKK